MGLESLRAQNALLLQVGANLGESFFADGVTEQFAIRGLSVDSLGSECLVLVMWHEQWVG